MVIDDDREPSALFNDPAHCARPPRRTWRDYTHFTEWINDCLFRAGCFAPSGLKSRLNLTVQRAVGSSKG
jgi:hypothetical protein